jgi:histidine ammonia-lyase
MAAENRRLATPASPDSVATSAMQEDHVSMGWEAARKLRRAVANLQAIVAVELTVAARALDLRTPLAPAAGTGAARDALRELVPGFGPDRHVAPELATVTASVADGTLLEAIEQTTGVLA